MKLTKEIPVHIFREYDIRGIYPKDLQEDISYTVGRSFGSILKKSGQKDCIVGHDNRLSSPSLTNSLIAGITDSGIDVLDLGLTTTPMYYYACIKKEIPRGIMVTASHNPKDDNGFKIAFDEKGNAKGKEIQDFYQFTIQGNFEEGKGNVQKIDVRNDYIECLTSKIDIKRPLKVVVDCGNGTTSILVHDVFQLPNLEVIYLFDESDPTFPNHHPDPSVDENMVQLSSKVKEEKADLGIAFDGDGDRVGVVDNLGRMIRMDVFMALFVKSLKEKVSNPKFLYDVKCGMSLQKTLLQEGVEGVMVRTGNSYTRAYTKEYDCILGGEYSGHIYFRDKFLGFDSGLYAGLRILELLSEEDKTLAEMVDQIPHFFATPEIKIPTSDEKKFQVIEKIKQYVLEKNYPFSEIDGIRIDFKDSWALVRASNTGANLTMRVEATTEEEENRLKKEFEEKIREYNDF